MSSRASGSLTHEVWAVKGVGALGTSCPSLLNLCGYAVICFVEEGCIRLHLTKMESVLENLSWSSKASKTVLVSMFSCWVKLRRISFMRTLSPGEVRWPSDFIQSIWRLSSTTSALPLLWPSQDSFVQVCTEMTGKALPQAHPTRRTLCPETALMPRYGTPRGTHPVLVHGQARGVGS